MQELTQGSVCKFILRTVYKVSFIHSFKLVLQETVVKWVNE